MQLSELSSAYESDGPFLTAYLEPGRPGFDSAHAVDVRWRDLERQLLTEGADEQTVEAAGGALAGERAGEIDSTGRVVVAAHGQVRLSERLFGPVGGDRAIWAGVPDLGPYARGRATSRLEVMAAIDRQGADVYVGDARAMSHEEITGETWPIHKIRGAGWAQRRIESTVEETADRNARLVADELVRLIGRTQPAVVLLAGDVEARENVRSRLPDHLGDLVMVTEKGSRNEADQAALDEALAEAAWTAERRRQRDLLERFRTREAHGLAVQGLVEVCRAFRYTAVEALIIAVDNPDAGTVADELRKPIVTGPEPTQLAPTTEELRRELVDSGADPRHDVRLTEVLAEAALIRAGAVTDSTFEVVTAAAAGLADSVGALLRFELPTGGTS